MQNFHKFQDGDYVSDAPSQLNGNFESVATDFQGSSFPTENLSVGMTCYRSDENVVYRLREDASNNLVWVKEYEVLSDGIKVAEASKADVATKADTATRAEKDLNGNTLVGYQIATPAEVKEGVDNTKIITPLTSVYAQASSNRLPNASYQIGDVVYHKSNLRVALKCTTAGTTSNEELDISTNVVTDKITDGSVVWKVIARNLDNGLTTDGFSLSAKREDGSNDNFVITNVANNGVFLETYKGAIVPSNLTARLALRHESNETRSGWFELEASDAVNKVSLIGKPNKKLLWDGKEIALVPNVQSNNIVAISPQIHENSNVTVSSLCMSQVGNVVTFRVEIILKATQSDWFHFASGIPKPATETTLYNTATTWGTSFVRGARLSVTTDCCLGIRYGAAGTYAHSFSYVTSEGV